MEGWGSFFFAVELQCSVEVFFVELQWRVSGVLFVELQCSVEVFFVELQWRVGVFFVELQ